MANSYEAAHSKNVQGYPYGEYPIANSYQADRMADSHSCQSSVWGCSEPYGTQLRSTPHEKPMELYLYRLSSTPLQTPMNWTLRQMP